MVEADRVSVEESKKGTLYQGQRDIEVRKVHNGFGGH